MPLARNAYVNLLRSKTGYHEGRDANGNWNNHQMFSPATAGLEWSQNQAWCHTFVSWGADELGERAALPITASCYTGVQWFKRAGRFSEYPILGGLFYMGSSGQDHVGVVYAYDANNIYTVEGNTNSGGSYQGDGVYQRVRPRRGSGSPYGYGAPKYNEGIISADPKWGGTPAASVPVASSRPKVSAAHIEAARLRDPGLPQGGTTYPAEVNIVEVALARRGFLADAYAHDGSFGSLTVQAYDAFRRAEGYTGSDATGSIGKQSLSKLGAASGFDVIS